ncbi:MAG: hypothetical protein AB1921_04140 [Thermodesulfobacteriota bacterium]
MLSGQRKNSNTGLCGMKDLVRYTGRDKRTVLKWIREHGFPARRLDGRWESDTVLIDEWRRKRILSRLGEAPPEKEALRS